MHESLPDDLIAFLRAGRQLEYDDGPTETGPITLKAFDALQVAWFPMQGDPELTPDDPRLEESGCYLVPGVDLVATAEHYDPSGLLIWFETERRFGAWDSSHNVVYIYPETVGWSDIVDDPARHLDATWNGELAPMRPWLNDHPYNAESVHESLPSVPEWYEFEWTLRGQRRNDVQVRWPFVFHARIGLVDRGVILTSRTSQPGENWSEWQPETVRELSDEEWSHLTTALESGFWDPAIDELLIDHSETRTVWQFKGWREPRYRTVSRFLGEDHVADEPTKTLGRLVAGLAGVGLPE